MSKQDLKIYCSKCSKPFSRFKKVPLEGDLITEDFFDWYNGYRPKNGERMTCAICSADYVQFIKISDKWFTVLKP